MTDFGYVAKRSDTDYIVFIDPERIIKNKFMGYNVVPLETDPHNKYTVAEVQAYCTAHPDKVIDATKVEYSHSEAVLMHERNELKRWINQHKYVKERIDAGLAEAEDFADELEELEEKQARVSEIRSQLGDKLTYWHWKLSKEPVDKDQLNKVMLNPEPDPTPSCPDEIKTYRAMLKELKGDLDYLNSTDDVDNQLSRHSRGSQTLSPEKLAECLERDRIRGQKASSVKARRADIVALKQQIKSKYGEHAFRRYVLEDNRFNH